jgi:hypothetical protein
MGCLKNVYISSETLVITYKTTQHHSTVLRASCVTNEYGCLETMGVYGSYEAKYISDLLDDVEK